MKEIEEKRREVIIEGNKKGQLIIQRTVKGLQGYLSGEKRESEIGCGFKAKTDASSGDFKARQQGGCCDQSRWSFAQKMESLIDVVLEPVKCGIDYIQRKVYRQPDG